MSDKETYIIHARQYNAANLILLDDLICSVNFFTKKALENITDDETFSLLESCANNLVKKLEKIRSHNLNALNATYYTSHIIPTFLDD